MTHEQILAAGRSLAFNDLVLSPTLQQLAAGAGVTVQTVLRHFGSRDEVLAEIERTARDEIAAERTPASTDVHAALGALLEHYERRGAFVMALIAREASDERAAQIARYGRAVHRQWVEDVFRPSLPDATSDRDEALDLLVVATDLFTWHLLRRDRGLPIEVVRDRMSVLITGALLRVSTQKGS
ncbi:TetR/AcrR family transcriptional regulator [uncultured Amnibacterium sp.]|uniref:TetR/AcrR family transcriptional regulator n=1 Tax=uncultured Amnibacterium sp. TaxID=1631851 RepID=UPI0035CA48C3